MPFIVGKRPEIGLGPGASRPRNDSRLGQWRVGWDLYSGKAYLNYQFILVSCL